LAKAELKLLFVTQKADGYREHTAMDRKGPSIGKPFSQVSEKQEIETQLLISDLNLIRFPEL